MNEINNQTDNTNRNTSQNEVSGREETQDRRELLRRVGKFAVYAAPFTVLAFAKKAQASSCAKGFGSCGGGGGKPTPR